MTSLQTLDAAVDLEDFDLDAWAAARGIALRDRAEMQQPLAPEAPSRDDLRREWRRFPQWTILKGVFTEDDHTAPDSFYAESRYVGRGLRYAIETDSNMRTRFIVDRLDGRGSIEVSDIEWLIDCFVGPNLTGSLNADLVEIDRILDAEGS